MKISIDPVLNLYPHCKIVNVEEYFDPANKWVSRLPDGTDVRDPDLYYGYGLNYVIGLCARDGKAKLIQLHIIDEQGEHCYPDFKIEELVS